MSENLNARKPLPLHWKMAIGFLAGLVLGLIVYAAGIGSVTYAQLAGQVCPATTAGADVAWQCRPLLKLLTETVTGPAGEIFLRLIFMLVIPLLFSALVMGVSEMGDIRSFGRVGWRTLGLTVLMSALAVILGLVMVNLFQPGAGVDPAQAQLLMSENAERAQSIVQGSANAPKGIQMLVSIVPSNVIQAAANDAILAVMFFALMIGVGMVLTRSKAVDTLREGIQGLFDISMTLIGLVIKLAPYAVFCFMFNLASAFGWDLLFKLAKYVAVVVAALAIHLFVVYSLALKFIGGRSPMEFFRGVQEAMVLAFSTASSNATLPTALRVAEDELHLPRRVSRFVLTVGATANQNGTALFEGVTVIFLAQFFGVDLSLGQQVMVMLVCILGGIGTAGVPSGSLPVVAMICAMVGVPAEGIGLILGVNHFLDMCRTTLNVTGDIAIAAMVSRGVADPPAESLSD
ncbi:sodium:dicarboxylate symporter family protein [Lysobacter antibioticus]|uniref:Sodium:dicarboxylate symporter family protein n=1 Tax=Lysobacter antibioticus TaxID=84531 RepID=A0A0S2E4B2_LYSAN|nr:dicarboxylate/amino acid:cation symporter [Lysobacter antibioticus]ALN65627.1 sodium:dicarboxylate symporter family protein [Lysobacter antibioticus]ALN82260.1 sodium:dicarboxylate symporter family protein [Lysobacter antibioticus]